MTVAYKGTYVQVLDNHPDTLVWEIKMPDGTYRYCLGENKKEVLGYIIAHLGRKPSSIRTLGTLDNTMEQQTLRLSDDGWDYLVRGDLEPSQYRKTHGTLK